MALMSLRSRSHVKASMVLTRADHIQLTYSIYKRRGSVSASRDLTPRIGFGAMIAEGAGVTLGTP